MRLRQFFAKSALAPGCYSGSMPRRAIKSVPGQIAVEPGAVPPKGVRAALIRKMKMRYPELSDSQIARRVGCSRQNVNQVLAVFLDGHSDEELRDFQASKADIYDAIQMRALASVTQEKLRKSSAGSLVTVAAILEDKARLIRGQATSINVQALLELCQLMREKRDRGQLARQCTA
jgi:hypothetical protein